MCYYIHTYEIKKATLVENLAVDRGTSTYSLFYALSPRRPFHSPRARQVLHVLHPGDVLVLGALDPSAEGGPDLGPAGTPGTVPGRDLHDGPGGGRGGLGDVEL